MTDSTNSICGAECVNGSECQRPAGWGTESDIGPCKTHDGTVNDNNPAHRERQLDAELTDAIYAAVGSGLKVGHVAAAAGVSADTLRRWTCCIDNLANPVPTESACDFCEGYAHAHAEGAREVLDDCRPEFRASASFGYNETQEVSGEGGGPVEINLSETVVETGYNE